MSNRPPTSHAAWQSTDDAQHRHGTPWWLQFYANELLLYFPDQPGRILELGCGNGDLYPFIRHRCTSYLGVDFSDAMLRRFRQRWPDADLLCADASAIPKVTGHFDFAFSNGLTQYFAPAKLDFHLRRLSELLDGNGSCLIANIPDKHLRWFYYAGALRCDSATSVRRFVRSWLRYRVCNKDDGIGHWYSRPCLVAAARRYGFTCQTFPSASYEYRFHALLNKAPG